MKILLILILILSSCTNLKHQSSSEAENLLIKPVWAAHHDKHYIYYVSFLENGDITQLDWNTTTSIQNDEPEKIGTWHFSENILIISLAYKKTTILKNTNYEITRISNRSLVLKDRKAKGIVKLKPTIVL